MFPFEVRFSYRYDDCYQEMWDQLKESKKRAYSKIFIFTLLIILTASNILSAFDIVVSYIVMLVSLAFLLKYIAYLIIIPVIHYVKRKKWGAVYIKYTRDGIESSVKGQANSTAWHDIESIEVLPNSFCLLRKNKVKSQRVPIRVFSDQEQFQRFVQEVKLKLK